jgi:excisionase family DNA binding protein
VRIDVATSTVPLIGEEVVMASQPVGEELLTPGGVAALLFVDRKTVSRWAQTGKLGSIRTPGGHRRFLRSDVLAIMEGSYVRDGVSEFPSQRPGIPVEAVSDAGAQREARAAAVVAEAVAIALEAEAAEAAEAVVLIAAAVAEAAKKAARAAQKAAGARAFAAEEAAQTVAAEAARTATRIQIRADVAAVQVATAARLAVAQVIGVGDESDDAHTAILAARVEAAAEAAAEATTRAAAVVATAVDTAAAQVARKAFAAEEAYEYEVTTAAEELLRLTSQTATRVAAESQARAAGVALAAREAAAALQTAASDGPDDADADASLGWLRETGRTT